MANCAKCHCVLETLTEKPPPEGALCLVCLDVKQRSEKFFREYPGGNSRYCWCGRQEHDHYILLSSHDKGLYCRKGSSKVFVPMPEAFEKQEVREGWEAFVRTLNYVPEEIANLMYSYQQWKGDE